MYCYAQFNPLDGDNAKKKNRGHRECRFFVTQGKK